MKRQQTTSVVAAVLSVTGLTMGGAALWRAANKTHPALPQALASLTPDAAHRPSSKPAAIAADGAGSTPSGTSGKRSLPRPSATPDPLASVLSAYNAGQYADAEATAARLIASSKPQPSQTPELSAAVKAGQQARRVVVRARHLMAFAAARRHDLKTARERFALAKQEAATLPGGGKVEHPKLGAPPAPSLEEDAAYQHAVCTNALGDKIGAEAEWIAFMKAYPESPLVQASIKRIARLHGGDIPQPAEAVWRSAMDTAQAREKAKRTAASVCGPECLAELVRRTGRAAPPITALASEMRTREQGTSLAALCAAAKRHGFAGARGLRLTTRGLHQTLNQSPGPPVPLIALIAPGHYVLVETVGADDSVTVWDPDGGGGAGKAATRTFAASVWARLWQGVALVVG